MFAMPNDLFVLATAAVQNSSRTSTLHHDLIVIGRIAAVIAIAWVAHRLIRRLIKRTIQGLQSTRAQKGLSLLRKSTPRALLNTGQTVSLRRVQRADTIGALLRSVSTVIIVVITAFSIIGQLSLDLRPILTSTAIATATLGFGAQNIVRDFLAGFFIVVEDQYGVGDVIYIDENASGTVESVSLRITRLRNADGTLWSVPNGEIKKVGNKSQTWSRAVVDFRVNLGTDINQAIHLMKDVADDMWQDSAFAAVITDEPEIWAPDAIDGDGILLKIALKTRPLEQWHISRILRSRIKKSFDQAGIRIASTLVEPYANGLPQD
jgi:moderate conductance mechanosensitive channel